VLVHQGLAGGAAAGLDVDVLDGATAAARPVPGAVAMGLGPATICSSLSGGPVGNQTYRTTGNPVEAAGETAALKREPVGSAPGRAIGGREERGKRVGPAVASTPGARGKPQ
jgi:hypothetical protein